MKKLGCIALVFAAACSSGGSANSPAAGPPPDAQLAQLQTSMTELLERLDVLNDRMTRLEQAQAEISSGAPAPSPASSAPSPHPTPPPAPSSAVAGARIADAYRSAIVLFGRNRLAESRAAFQKVFDTDPHGELADNALFWIGETYYSAGQYGDAMRFYSRVTRDFPDQNKAPDAMFKLALAYERTSDLGLARKTLEEVISRYPYSTSAASAKAELKRIRY
jgi:tol-pal system protein YbgF